MELLEKCICGNKKAYRDTVHGIPILVCSRCCLFRQSVEMTEQELDKYYEETYHPEHYQHSYAQDCRVAVERLENYRLGRDINLLDVGSGNGAFVEEARACEINAYGVEIAKGVSTSRFVYSKPLQEIHLPTDNFNVVTLHDVVEHFVRPVEVLEEVFRIVKQKGHVIIDLPNFHVEAGKHHWKETEHLWFFNERELKMILENVGFEIERIENPIPSKLVFYLRKPEQERVKIMVPPGIGDGYWPLVKMGDFCKQNGLGLPDVYISSPNKAGRDRSIDFVKRCPFVNAKGYLEHTTTDGVFDEAYRKDGRTIFEKKYGMDYFMSYNGVLTYGKSLDLVDTQYKADWLFPMFESLEEKRYGEEFKKRHGEYIVAYFIPHGMYKYWLNEFNVSKIRKLLRQVRKDSGREIVLVGAGWDENTIEKDIITGNRGFVNLVGKTSLEEVFGLIRGSDGVIGMPSGLTIMSTVFKKPTMILWNDYFHSSFWWNSCPPQARENWYRVANTRTAVPEQVSIDFGQIVGYKKKELSKSEREKHGDRTYKKLTGKLTSSRKKEAILTPSKEPKKTRTRTKSKRGRGKKLTVACTLWGSWGGGLGEQYVEKLYRACRRNIDKDFKFICFSDNGVNLQEQIEVRPLDAPSNKHLLSKMVYYNPDNGLRGRVLALDLDTVFTGNIKDFVEYDGDFAMRGGFKDPKMTSGDFLSFEGGFAKEMIWEPLCKQTQWIEEKTHGDDRFVYKLLCQDFKIDFWQDMFPGQLISFKHHMLRMRKKIVPPEVNVISFHGHPRPHEITGEWIKEYWK